MTELKDLIARNLRKYRIESGMSQIELAEKLHMRSSSISNWEKGRNPLLYKTQYRRKSVKNGLFSRVFRFFITEIYFYFTVIYHIFTQLLHRNYTGFTQELTAVYTMYTHDLYNKKEVAFRLLLFKILFDASLK